MDLNGIFSGFTVIELASVLAGPAVGQFFAELGAKVIKIENHKAGGDVTRSWKVRGEESGDVSSYFSCVNWGKKSVGVDLSRKPGQDLVYRLIQQADFVITSFKPGGAEKLSMDYKTLRSKNPAIIYGSITGYGEKDSRVGYDAIIQAEAGFMSMNGEPGGDPLKMPVALMDILAAHHLKQALLLAHIQRLKSGQGMEVSVSLFDAAVASLANQATNYLMTGHVPQPKGSLHPNIAPYGESFFCADRKKILLAIGNDAQFVRLCAILQIPEVALNPDFMTNLARLENREALSRQLQEAVQKVNSERLLEHCRQEHVPVGLIRTLDEVLNDPAVHLLEDGEIRGLPSFASNHTPLALSAPPYLGEHTEEILTSMLAPGDMLRLKQEHIIG